MMTFLAERLVATIIGLVVGVLLAIGWILWVGDTTDVWAFAVFPLVCALAGLLVGERAYGWFKTMLDWS
jgi:uncharacterized membrane protein YccC